MITVALPLPADAVRNPEQWNKDWEALLDREFGFPRGPIFCFESMMVDNEALPQGIDDALSSYQNQLAHTCGLQRNLTEDAQDYFATKNLEARGMRAGADVRRAHILGGMAAVCAKARNLNIARAYCAPELHLSRLRLDGKVFLNLLRSAMLEDASFIPSTPRYVSHPKWDAFAAEQTVRNDTDSKKLALAEVLLLRTKLICEALLYFQ